MHLADPHSNPAYNHSNTRIEQQPNVGFRGVIDGNDVGGRQGGHGIPSRGGASSHHSSHITGAGGGGGMDRGAVTQVTVLGDSPTDYVAAGTRSGDFMGVPKTKQSLQGKGKF